MTEKKIEVSELFTEMAMGTAVVAAFVLSRLEESGVLEHDETVKELKRAVDLIPEDMHGHPRYNALAALHILANDPAMKHALPFPWK